jgi:CDGSH-type Zn-finger protein
MPGHSQVSVTECPDGPLLVRGDIVLVRGDGSRVSTRRQTVALCRCAGSQILPLCDGTHRSLVPRRTPDSPA